MATLISSLPGTGFVLRIPERLRMTEDDFFEFCIANKDLRIERSAEGDILIMAPEGSETSEVETNITTQLANWAHQNRNGRVFGSNAGFTLPNGSVRSPDASWILKSRWNDVPKPDRKRFAHICPDFVVELKSPSDSISAQQSKMDEYMANGARLGWLIDPDRKRVYVYRPDRPVQLLENISVVSAEPELPGFTLDLTRIWDPDAE